MISCSDAVKQLWEYLDGSVEGPQREAIEEHLGVCKRCCGEVEFAEELRKFLAGHSSQDLPEDVRARLVGYLQGL
jgi:anti-sigma factor (TIGR02949 family)